MSSDYDMHQSVTPFSVTHFSTFGVYAGVSFGFVSFGLELIGVGCASWLGGDC